MIVYRYTGEHCAGPLTKLCYLNGIDEQWRQLGEIGQNRETLLKNLPQLLIFTSVFIYFHWRNWTELRGNWTGRFPKMLGQSDLF